MQGQYYIYRYIRNDTNVPFYIGRGKVHYKNAQGYTNYSLRSIYGRAYSSDRNKTCKSIIEKYGHEVEIMYHADTIEEADRKEKEFISLYGSVYDGTGTLVNLTKGGSDFIPTKEMVRRHKEAYANSRSVKKVCRPIYMFDCNGSLIDKFDRLKDVHIKYGIGDVGGCGISWAAKKKHTYNGYIFSFDGQNGVDVSEYKIYKKNKLGYVVYDADDNVVAHGMKLKSMCNILDVSYWQSLKYVDTGVRYNGFLIKKVEPHKLNSFK